MEDPSMGTDKMPGNGQQPNKPSDQPDDKLRSDEAGKPQHGKDQAAPGPEGKNRPAAANRR